MSPWSGFAYIQRMALLPDWASWWWNQIFEIMSPLSIHDLFLNHILYELDTLQMFSKIITFFNQSKTSYRFFFLPSFSWTHIKCIFTIYSRFSLGAFLLWFFLFVWRFCSCINYSLAKSDLEKPLDLKGLVRLLVPGRPLGGVLPWCRRFDLAVQRQCWCL